MSGVPAAADQLQSASTSIRARIVEAGTASSSSSRSKILLPVDVIRSLKLQTGDALLIVGETAAEDDFFVGSVWPSFALETGTIRLPISAHLPPGLQSGQTVSILPLNSTQAKATSRKPPSAAMISLSVSYQQSDSLSAFAKLGKSDRQMLAVHAKECLAELEYVHQGQVLPLSFQGGLYSIRISSMLDNSGRARLVGNHFHRSLASTENNPSVLGEPVH